MNPVSMTSLISGALAAQNTGVEIGIATLKKTNDIAKTEGAALVQMIEDAMQLSERLLDTYA
jgi:hypothetical protein